MIEILYKRKIIRDFLSLFSDLKWNQLIIHTLEYGILQLKQKCSLASLSIDDIINLVGNIYNYLDVLKDEETKDYSKNISEPIQINKKRTDFRTKDVGLKDRDDKRGSSIINKKKRSVSKRINSSCNCNFVN
jgi:hypothetical protein